MDRTLAWRHASLWRRVWTLSEGHHEVLRLTQKGGLGLDADLEAGGRRWRVEHEGWWRPTVRVRDAAGVPLASIRLGWRGQGEMILANGRRLRWEADNWWGTRWSLRDAAGAAWFTIDVGRRWGFGADATLPAGARDEDVLPLVGLAWLVLVYTLQAAYMAAV